MELMFATFLVLVTGTIFISFISNAIDDIDHEE